MFKLMKNLKWIDWILIIITISCVLIQTFFEMEFINHTELLLEMVKSVDATSGEYWSLGLKMLGLAGIILIAIILKNVFSSFISSKIAKDLRKQVFLKVNNFSLTEINKFSTSSLITRSTNDIMQVQRTINMMLTMMFTAPFMAIFAIRKILSSSMQLTLTNLVFLGGMLIMMIVLLIFVIPKFSKMQKNTDRLNLVTRENLTGIRVVRAYNGEKYQENKFDNANENLTKTNLFVNRLMSLMNPGLSLIMNTMTLAIYWIGAKLINNGDLQYPAVATFSQYSMHVIMSFMFIALMFVLIPRGLVSLKRINEILDTEVSIKDGNIEKSEEIGTIEFRNVTFSYPDAKEPVIEDISFKINRGETVAFIGSTGSGKSTLINLIPRFYDVTSGQVLVDGIDVKAYNQEYLHNKIGYVPQKANLFSGDITSNMKLANENITNEEIEVALNVAQCTFIEKLEDGYIQPVSQGGKNFSGGQKQRLSIARAIAKNPEIFIFDDSFSALDFKTDKVLRNALKNHTKDATCVIVAQRINTIINADKIIVMDNGKMVGMGTHAELLKSNKVYKEIAESQLSKENL